MKLTLNEAETVAAGTVGEMEELVSALVDNGFICAVSVAASHTPGLNNLQMDSVVSDLKKLGVRAEIDLGWAGTGIGSEANKYYSSL